MWPFSVFQGLESILYSGYVLKSLDLGIKLFKLLASKRLAFSSKPSKINDNSNFHSTTRSSRSYLA